MLALPAMAKAPAEGATLTLDDTLLTLDQSEETFVATLKVPVSQEQKNWADNQWKDWADSIQWSLTRDKVDVQSPEYYPNIYTGDDLENWMSWGHINQHGADGEPYFSLEEPEFSVRDGFVTVVQQFSHGIFFNMKDETLPLVTNSLQAIGSNTFRYARNVWPSFIGNYELAARVDGEKLAGTPMEINVYESNVRYDELYHELMEIKGLAEAKGRYFDVQSFGKSTDGRDQWYAVVSDSAESVESFKKMNAQAQSDPEAVLEAIEGGMDYRMPIMMNNCHPDEAGGVDAHTNLLRTLATEDTVTWNTITGLTGGKQVDMGMYDPKIVDFALESDDGGTEYAFTGYGLKISATTINGNGNDGRTDASEYYTFSEDKQMSVDEILDNLIIIVVPDENPDGRTYNTRPNGNGFDLNRDASNQTQNETTNLVQVINDWNPVVFAELHGYMTEFLVEPCTPPHEPNLEYDLLVKNFALGSEAFGTAALGTMSATREEHPDTLYWSYYMPLRDDYDPSTMHWSAWDDLCTNYGPSYAMLNCGSLGYTIETPYNNEASTDLFEYGVYGLIDYVMEHKDDIYHNQLEFFRRGIENEDHRDSMEKWYVDVNNKQLQSDTWRVPYEENDNYFPEYYVIPVDAASQRDPADAYAMGRFLLRNGVRVSSLDTDTAVGGVTYRAGSLVVDMHQAKRNYANAVLWEGADASASGFPDLYSESVTNFPAMRGFDCIPIAAEGAFDGKLTEVSTVTGRSQLTGTAGDVVILSNNGSEAVRAVNALLDAGRTVSLITSGDHKGDFALSLASYETVADDFVLSATRTAESPAASAIRKPTLFLAGRYDAFSGAKLTEGYFAQWFRDGYGFRNYRNVYSNGTSNYDIETYIDQLGFTVTDDPAKADIIVGNVALDQGEKGAAAVAAVKAGTPYIATGSDPLEYISKNLVTDLTYTTLGMEALHTVTYPTDSLITASYAADGDHVLYTYSCGVLTSVPAGATVLIQAAEQDSFIAGCCLNENGTPIDGFVEAIALERDGMDLTIFANSVNNRAHQQDDYRYVTNAIYAKMSTGGTGFTDVPASHWAAGGIAYAVENGLMTGTSRTTFAPAAPTTRGMMMTILARQDGVSTSGGGTWYEKGMAWAKENGISDGSAPNGSITREQLAVMLHRTIEYLEDETGRSVLADAGGLESFTDAGQVSGWAADSLAALTASGILQGTSSATLSPKDTTTVEQAILLTLRAYQEFSK